MLRLRSPFIEDFLKSATAQQPETTTMFDLLWKFYEKSGQYVAAAKILNKLADRHSTDLRWSKGFLLAPKVSEASWELSIYVQRF